MTNVNLTKIDNSVKVGLTKGATQQSLNITLAQAKTYRDDAEAFDTSAGTYSSYASSSASLAESYKNLALTYSNNASTSATNAGISESNASTSESNALSSANSASTSASNALTSETNASASASSASASATNASTSETNASNSALSASTSASNAATSETNAATSEANALSYANSINPSTILYTIGNGGGNPEGYTKIEADILLGNKVDKVTSTDNAVVRFNGTGGDVQNSGVFIDDNGNFKNSSLPSQINTDTLKGIDTPFGVLFSRANGAGIGIVDNITFVGEPTGDLNANTNYTGSASSTGYIQVSGTHKFYTAPSGTGGNPATLTERMRILPTGGITFNGDTSTANALDDYEEGTWTPSLSGYVSCNGGYVSAALYTKIGNLATVQLSISSFNITGTAWNITFPLPISAYMASNSGYPMVGTCLVYNGTVRETAMVLDASSGNSTTVWVGGNNPVASVTLYISITYRTA